VLVVLLCAFPGSCARQVKAADLKWPENMAAILGKILNGEVTLEDLDFPLKVDGKEVSYTHSD